MKYCRFVFSLIILLILLVCCVSAKRKISKDLIFSLSLSHCFENETIHISFEDQLSLDFKNVQTDPILGIANVSFNYYKSESGNYLLVRDGNIETRYDLTLKNNFNLDISKLNEFAYPSSELKIDVSLGWNILLNGCKQGDPRYFAVTYYDNVILFD